MFRFVIPCLVMAAVVAGQMHMMDEEWDGFMRADEETQSVGVPPDSHAVEAGECPPIVVQDSPHNFTTYNNGKCNGALCVYDIFLPGTNHNGPTVPRLQNSCFN
ncbi:hypothetical protein DdX_20184 [Ditylenchus destructor]|uniref:Secreted protein n=1 Tax=Ditylenchus destructor TaxID=166010 RepID=A0AAD4QTS1_9BILA|nr:hypothetical protein DdX_20184 [Ditylenchus destructor]